MSSLPDDVGEGMFITLSRSSVHILLPRYLMNGFDNFDKTDRKYLVAPIGDLIDLIRFWKSPCDGVCIHIDAGASKSVFLLRSQVHTCFWKIIFTILLLWHFMTM